MGADAAGEVIAVGADVQGFAVGDQVAPHFLLSCGRCRNRIAGKENICLNSGVLGVTTWSTYVAFVKVPAQVLDLVAAGRLKPVVFKAFDVGEAGEAHRVMESRNFFGRMLMHPWGNA
jgi:D-arabinose 1-dehydrogenase-like Zn-dependent alcohol dehydrogenase